MARCNQPTGLGKSPLGGFCQREGRVLHGGRCWQHRVIAPDYEKARAERRARMEAEEASGAERRTRKRLAAQQVIDLVLREAGNGTMGLGDLYNEIERIVEMGSR